MNSNSVFILHSIYKYNGSQRSEGTYPYYLFSQYSFFSSFNKINKSYFGGFTHSFPEISIFDIKTKFSGAE